MNSSHEDPIETLLRQSFDVIPDDGFCDRVMQRLPPHRRAPAWPLAAGIVLGIATCCASLFATTLWRAGWRDWLHGELSVPAIITLLAMGGMSLLTLGWSLAEAEDR
jgi:H+/Cl- antiporter ClcA